MIDNATVSRILDTADIVEVVSDFVTLRKRGQNYVGLCPFHNDRSPSFYVSKNKQMCKCFSCGEGGSAVGFIMKHQSMTYVEALKYLANKYHIEVHEREITDEERENQRHRDALLMVNEWACKFFEQQLHETTEGKEVGLSYFAERGFDTTTIKKFRLGYSPEDRRALYQAATEQGFSRELLFETGLCVDDNHGGGYDRYRGRVIFPILNVAGKIVAFGGRTLKKEKNIAKYVNSPESVIYSKRKEIYGLYQAKREIGKQGKCYIVEGYADVISMHQSGFENVIASSGTALTHEHINLIHRFTENVTEMFDGDEAGIRAAIKGIDKILAQGLNMKVLLLPDNDDPDSYSRKHSATEIQQYIDDNETDFIRFKGSILLKDTGNDPTKRAQAIEEITKSIAVIPSDITRAVYAKECSSMFGISEATILKTIARYVNQIKEEEFRERQRRRIGEDNPPATIAPPPPPQPPMGEQPEATAPGGESTTQPPSVPASAYSLQEKELIRLIVRYGMCKFTIYLGEQCEQQNISVLEYVRDELSFDRMEFDIPAYKHIYEVALGLIPEFYDSLPAQTALIQQEGEAKRQRLLADIDPVGHSADSLEQEAARIGGMITAENVMRLDEYRAHFLMRHLCSHPADDVRNVSCDLASDRYTLSKIHTELATIPTEVDRLNSLVPSAINNWKGAIIDQRIRDLSSKIAVNVDSHIELMKQLQDLHETRRQIAMLTGERVVNVK